MARSALSISAARAQFSGRADCVGASGRYGPGLTHVHAGEDRPLLRKDDIEVWLADRRGSDEIDMLVTRMYRQRGYLIPKPRILGSASSLRRVTLEVRHEGRTVGTLSVNLGGVGGLNAEELYAEEIRPYRARGAKVCEFTRLALDSEHCSKQMLGCLFHLGVMFAFHVYRATDLFIEVNPRHALFYERKLNFALVGGEKLCPRVSAPAVLLHKDLAECTQEIARLGGVRAPENRTFYAFMLPQDEAQVPLTNMRTLFPRAS